MADKDLVEILLQGPEIWNEWRKNNPRKIDLSKTSLTYANLKEPILERSILIDLISEALISMELI